MKSLRNKKGFTLIELIIIIVILGILAAIAIPKYIDMKSEANKAVAKGVIGALSGADNILFANYLLYGTTYDNANILSNAGVSGATVSWGAPGTVVVGGTNYTFTYTVHTTTSAGQYQAGF